MRPRLRLPYPRLQSFASPEPGPRADASPTRCASRCTGLGAPHRGRRGRGAPPTRTSRRPSSSTSRTRSRGTKRPAQPRVPVLHDSRRAPGERASRARAPAVRPTPPSVPAAADEDCDMSLPAPNLDDRRFQDLVDDAKRLVQQRCPSWTDHNVHDPGVTLIETFAYHDRPAALPAEPRARTASTVKFPRDDRRPALSPADRGACRRHLLALGAAARGRGSLPAGSEVATSCAAERARSPSPSPRWDELRIVSARRSHVASSIHEHEERDHTDAAGRLEPARLLPVRPGGRSRATSMLVGLTSAVPSCANPPAASNCEIEGVGVDPRRSPARLGGR